MNTIELYQGYTESPYAKVAEVLGRMGLQDAKLGLEKSYINSNRWEEIQGLLPRARLMDCATMMAEVRWIKTPGEVERIRRAADILDEAYLEVFSTVKRGDTEREVHGRIVGACILRGAQWAHGMLSSSRNDVLYGGEGEMQFQPGDIIRNDYVSYYLGYPGHQNRVAVVGEPSAEQRRLYGTVRDIYRATIGRCKPGVKAIDVYRYAVGAFRREGFTERFNIVGHGLGAMVAPARAVHSGPHHRGAGGGDGACDGAGGEPLASTGPGPDNRQRPRAPVRALQHGRDVRDRMTWLDSIRWGQWSGAGTSTLPSQMRGREPKCVLATS